MARPSDPAFMELQHAAELLELGDAFFELDRDWRIVRVNANQERLSRRPRAETLGRVFWEVWPEIASPETQYWREYHRCMEERVPVQFQDYFAPLDLWTGVTGYPLSTGGMAVFFRDISPVKHAEEEQRRLAAIVEDSDDAIISKDLGGAIRTWNAGAERLFGYAAGEIVGRSITLLLPPDRRDEEDRIMEEIRAGRRVSHFVTRRVRKDGSTIDVSVTVSPLRDASGAVAGASKIARDITEQVQAERRTRAAAQAAEDERRRLATVLEALPVGVAIADGAGALTHVNAEFQRIWGGPPSPRGVEEYGAWRGWWPDGRPIAPEEWALARAVRIGEVVPGDVLDIEKFDGTGRATIINAAAPIRNAGGAVVGGVLTEVDITVQRRAEAAAHTAERRMRAVVEHLPIGLIVADLGAGALHWNAEALRIHGYTGEGDEHRFVESLVAEHELRTLAGEPVPVAAWPLPRLLEGESFRDYELRVRNTRLGWERVFSYSGVVTSFEGAPELRLLAIQDVSARSSAEAALRAANDRLREADRRKDEFLGMLSHELRNPLAPIRNALYILDRAPAEGVQARRAKEIVNRQVSHLTRLVDDLLDVTRIARGKIELRREDLDLADLLRRAGEDYRPTMQRRGLQLEVEVPPAPAVVHGDPARLTQVIGNLLNNAAKFTPAGGRVRLSLRVEGGRAELHVEDTGPGIAPELLPRLFEPFTQGEQTLARSEGGLGLGLSLVKGLVALHGGEVAVRARAGGGADFVVTLALARAGAERAERVEVVQGSAGPRHRVLVVDDNRDAAESLGELVRMLGHEVELAYDGPSAVAQASRTHPDLVLCDIGLPGMDGYQVARELRARQDGAVRLVALSGYAAPEDVTRALDAGFDRHVAKPPDPGKIEGLLGA